jgi:hypothetical protein
MTMSVDLGAWALSPIKVLVALESDWFLVTWTGNRHEVDDGSDFTTTCWITKEQLIIENNGDAGLHLLEGML